jgi:fructose-bisphosphate aldolase class II
MLVTLNEVLKKAQKEKYAVGLFNTVNTEMLQAAIEAAEEAKSPIILGTAEVLLPYGALSLIAPSVIAAAKRASVPVVVHYDHGLTFECCLQALKLGFSSIMYDCSTLAPQENTAAVREMAKIAHAFGASIEGEIGHVGGAEGVGADNPADPSQYTSPEGAVAFVKATGVDALAVAIGTAHGSYKVKPVLDVERLKAIRRVTDTPLVLHGGSGLSESDFHATIANGIAKVNIFTDLCLAAKRAVLENQGLDYPEIRNKQKDYIKAEITKRIKLFGSINKG